MQRDHGFLDLVFLLDGEVHGLVVVVLSLEVVSVLVDGFFGHLALGLFVFELGIFFHEILILVAALLPACAGAVLRPVAHAQPAELVRAASARGGARHVVAALVLLDWFAALWTGLGVGDDPLHVLALG